MLLAARHEPDRIEFITLDVSWLDAVSELEQRCYPSPWSKKLIYAEFAKPVSFRPAILINGELVAYSFNYIIADELYILNVAVHPDFRGRGLGKLLLRHILEEAYRRKVRQASLEVRVSNMIAQYLYASLGFRFIGTRKRYYRDTGEDALVLNCGLTSQKLDQMAAGSTWASRPYTVS